MNNFQPHMEARKMPFFDDVNSSEGWEGHTTSKSIEKLEQEIAQNLALIECILTGCQSGKFGDRYGFQIHFAMKAESGKAIPSRLDIACLPIDPKRRTNRVRGRRPGRDWRVEGTQKMALYMTAKAIKGMYFLNVLSPSFIPFMSLMLTNGSDTLGELWIQQGQLAQLMPGPTEKFDIVDGIVEA